MTRPPPLRSAVVTGASSGLGAALVLACAGPGVHLGLLGRDTARLAAVAGLCRARGAVVATAALDVRDAAGMADWLRALDQAAPVDLIVANAGIAGGAPELGGPEPVDTARTVFDTNVGGVLNTLHPLLPGMVARRRGRAVLVSSLAAFVALPDYPAYSGAKAALLAYGLALRADLARHGVSVCVACPGFVATPMAEGYRGRRPSEVSAEAAARRILAGSERDRAVIAFPPALALAARLGGILPNGVRRWGAAALGPSLGR